MKKLFVSIMVFIMLFGLTVMVGAEDLFRLNWSADGIHAPFYLAWEKGYYEEEGLDLTIKEGSGSGVTTTLVGNNSATFGFADAGTAMLGIANGIPAKIIAPIYKMNGFCILALKESGITKPKDLEGKRVGVTPGDALSMLWPGIVNANNLDEDKIKLVSMASDAKTIALMQGKVDAVLEGADSGAIEVKMEGYDVNVLRFAEYGLQTMGLAILASDRLIEENPEKIRAFLTASFRGWLEAYRNPEAAVNILLKYFPDMGFEKAMESLDVALNSMFTDNSKIIGMPTNEEWETHYNILKKYGELETEKPYTYFYDMSVLPYWLPRQPDL